jgi:hypothetical protein
MTAGVRGKKHSTENDAGAGLANTVPPSGLAKAREENSIDRPFVVQESRSAADEETQDERTGDLVADEGGEWAIFDQFARMLDGIRKLPRQLRPVARREACGWLCCALEELRKKQMINRQADHEVRRQRIRRRDVSRRRPPGPNT